MRGQPVDGRNRLVEYDGASPVLWHHARNVVDNQRGSELTRLSAKTVPLWSTPATDCSMHVFETGSIHQNYNAQLPSSVAKAAAREY